MKTFSPSLKLFLLQSLKEHSTWLEHIFVFLRIFLPDVIKIDWKENGGTILQSQQGDTMKTKDKYVKFSWLTVTGVSMDNEHKSMVKHKSNKGGVDQEILFPSINKDLVAAMGSEMASQGHSVTRRHTELTAINSTKTSLKDDDDHLQLQLMNISVCYIYTLLLFKSLVYSAIITTHLLGRPALYGNGKSS